VKSLSSSLRLSVALRAALLLIVLMALLLAARTRAPAQTGVTATKTPPASLVWTFQGQSPNFQGVSFWISGARVRPPSRPSGFGTLATSVSEDLPAFVTMMNLTVRNRVGEIVFQASQLESVSWEGTFYSNRWSRWFVGTTTFRLSKAVTIGPEGLTTVHALVRYTMPASGRPSLSIDIDEFGANGLHVKGIPFDSSGSFANLFVWW
jgi:hypothetical protein